MLVKVIIKMEKDKDNNKILSTTKEMSMYDARKLAKIYNKKGVLWIKAKWFGTWHMHYRTLWEKENN